MPWSPDGLSRHDIALLVDEAHLDLTTTHWPLPAAAVRDALQRLPGDLPEGLAAARSRLLAALRSAGGGAASLAARNTAEALPGFGDDATPGSRASLRSPVSENTWFAAQAGVQVERPATGSNSAVALRGEGSALAGEAWGVQLQATSHRSWWGPGWQSSLILSNNAPAVDSVGLLRAAAGTSESPWLAWLGPWNAEFFIGRLAGVVTPAHPYLVGSRLTARPFSFMEIAVTRTAQWGGRGKDESLKSFVDMLVGTHLNADTTAQQRIDPANELAGFDLRLRCPSGLRCAGYGQLIGEDQAGVLPSNYLGLYGVEAWSADGGHRWFAEYAETGCATPVGKTPIYGCAYRNYAYPGGYVNERRWLGASVGPDSRLLTLGWIDVAREATWRLHYGNVGSRIGSFSPVPGDPTTSGHLVGASARRAYQWGVLSLEPEASWLRIRAANATVHDVRLGLTLSAPIGRP